MFLTRAKKWLLVALVTTVSVASVSVLTGTLNIFAMDNTQDGTSDTGVGITPAAAPIDLKSEIEAATSDLTLQLDAGTYTFTSEIKNTQAIKITLIGAVDANGEPATQFVMDPSVTGNPRFIRAEAGTLELQNISVTGTKGVNGGISAKNVIVDNSVFTNNYTNDGVSGGGAIRVTGGTLDVNNSVFIGNSVGTTSDGGAISSEYSGNVTINNSYFQSNQRIGNNNQYGGAISIKQPGVANTVITITNSIFKSNEVNATGSWTRGGAIHILSTNNVANVLIDNNLFDSNKASNGISNNGGAVAFMNMTTQSTISNSTFINNSSTKYGGAVYYENSTGNNNIINSTFVGNTSLFASSAVGAYSSKVTIDSSTVISNTFGTYGTNPMITIKDSIVAGTATVGTASIVYTGTNIAKKTSGEPTVDPASVLTNYTASTLVKVSDHNYVAPIIVGGAASKAITTPRSLTTAQNGLERKSPLSDAGAYEAPYYYTVTFDTDGGTAVSSQTVQADAMITLPTEPTKEGFIFAGWFLDSGTFANAWDFATDTVTADTTLYAKWDVPAKYHVYYNANGATSGSVPTDANDYLKNSTTQIKEKGGLVKDHATFLGWSTDPSGQGTLVQPYDTYEIVDDVTFYAIWKNDVYKLDYNANGGTGTTPVDANEYEYNQVASVLDKGDLTRSGYTFKGWALTANAILPTIQPNDAYTVEDNTTLYAVWAKDQYTLTYDANGATSGSVPSDTNTYAYDDTATIANQGSLVRDGYTFKGWSTTKTDTTPSVLPNASYKMTQSTTLYAVWEKDQYTLTYDANGATSGTIPTDANVYTYDQDATILSPTNLERTGYTFVGWSTTKDGQKPIYLTNAKFKMTQSTTLYATWVKTAPNIDPGKKDVTPSKYDVVPSGDTTNMNLLLALLATSAAGILLVIRRVTNNK